MACFLPLGFLLALARRRDSGMCERRLLMGAALLAPGSIELLQLFVYSRSFDLADIVTGAVGVLVGWRLGQFVMGRDQRGVAMVRSALASKSFVLAMFVGWLVAVVYVYWRPFEFTADPSRFTSDPEEFTTYGIRRMALAPFADYYFGSKYNALDQFFRKALSFAPLGVLTAVSSKELYPRNQPRRLLLAALAIALILEAGRYFLPTHNPSTTDVIIACAGAWCSFQVTRLLRVTLWADAALYGWTRSSPHSAGHVIWDGGLRLPRTGFRRQ